MQNEAIALIFLFILLAVMVFITFAQDRKIRQLEDDNAELRDKCK